MFRIICTVPEDKLVQAMRALESLGASDIQASTIGNGQDTTGATKPSGGVHIIESMKKHLKAHNVSKFNASFAREFVRQHGRPATYYPLLLNKMIEEGVIKKTGRGTGTIYVVK